MTSSFSADVSLYAHYARAAASSPLFHSLPRRVPRSRTCIYLVPLTLPLPYALGFALLAALPGIVSCSPVTGSRSTRAGRDEPVTTCLLGRSRLYSPGTMCSRRLTPFLRLKGRGETSGAERGLWAVLGGTTQTFPVPVTARLLLIERAQTGNGRFRQIGATCVRVAILTMAQSAVDAEEPAFAADVPAAPGV